MSRRRQVPTNVWHHRCPALVIGHTQRTGSRVLPHGEHCTHCGATNPRAGQIRDVELTKARLKATDSSVVAVTIPNRYRAEFRAFALQLRQRAANLAPLCQGQYEHIRAPGSRHCARCQQML